VYYWTLPKTALGCFHSMVLSGLWEVMVRHIACGRVHVTIHVVPDVPPYMIYYHQPARHDSSKVESPGHMPTYASQCIAKYAWLPPQSASLNSLHHGYRVYLEIRSVNTSNGIFKLARSWPRRACLSLLGQHFQTHRELLSSSSRSLSRYTLCRWVAT